MDRSYPCEAWVVGRKKECSRQKSLIQEITQCGVGTESSQGDWDPRIYVCEFETRVRIDKRA